VISKSDGLSGKFCKLWNSQRYFDFPGGLSGLEIVGKGAHIPVNVDSSMILATYALVIHMKFAAIG